MMTNANTPPPTAPAIKPVGVLDYDFGGGSGVGQGAGYGGGSGFGS